MAGSNIPDMAGKKWKEEEEKQRQLQSVMRFTQTQNFRKIVWNKHDLIISSSLGSGHTDNYLYEITNEY